MMHSMMFYALIMGSLLCIILSNFDIKMLILKLLMTFHYHFYNIMLDYYEAKYISQMKFDLGN
jgi:hypothetical protein